MRDDEIVKCEFTKREVDIIRQGLSLFMKSQVIGHNEDGTIITKCNDDGDDPWSEAFSISYQLQYLIGEGVIICK